MTDDTTEAFRDRLHRLAVDLILPTGLDVRAAVVLADEVVAALDAGPATLAVAALNRDALVSDAEQPVREMLAEQGIEVPQPSDEQAEYEVLLTAFGYWDLPLCYFEGPFYIQIPAWEDQGPLDRALVTLLDRRDHESIPKRRHAVEQQMRAAVRRHVGRG